MPAASYSFPLFYLNQGKERQAIINGGFDIWQRGEDSGFFTGTRYTADRWFLEIAQNTVNAGCQKVILDPSDEPMTVGLRNSIMVYQEASPAQAHEMVLTQAIPGVSYGNGGQVTLSMWAWSEQYNKIPKIKMRQVFGSGGSVSPPVELEKEVNWELDYTPTRFSVVFDLPSTSGKNIAVTGDDSLEIGIFFEPLIDVEVFITGVQVNTGGIPLPYLVKSVGEEMADCLQFYERRYYKNTVSEIFGEATSTTSSRGSLSYSPKWRVPHRVAVGPVLGNWAARNGMSFIAFNELTFRYDKATPTNIDFEADTATSVKQPGDTIIWHCNSINGYIEIDAEL